MTGTHDAAAILHCRCSRRLRIAAQKLEEFEVLLLSNLPHDCSERELHALIESRGISALSIRIVRDDHPAGASPAFGDVELDRTASVREAARLLNGMRMQGRIIQVREAAAVPQERTLLARRTSGLTQGISHTKA